MARSDDEDRNGDNYRELTEEGHNGDVVRVRVTRNDFKDFFKKLEKKSKNMKTSLAHVAALIAKYHFKHYTLEEGPSEENGGQLKPWPDLDPLYQNAKKQQWRTKMLRNEENEIYNQIKGGSRSKPPPGAQIGYGRDFVEVGILSEKYAILHEGDYTRLTGNTRKEKLSGTPIDKTLLARRIIGLAETEKTELFEDYATYFRKELEDL